MSQRSQSTTRAQGPRSARLQEIMRSNSTMRSRIAQSRLHQRQLQRLEQRPTSTPHTSSTFNNKNREVETIDLSRSSVAQEACPRRSNETSPTPPQPQRIYHRTESYGDAKPGQTQSTKMTIPTSMIGETTPSTVNTSINSNESPRNESGLGTPQHRQVKDLRQAFAAAANEGIPFDEAIAAVPKSTEVPWDEAPRTPAFETPRRANNQDFDDSFNQHGVIRTPSSNDAPPAFEDYFLPVDNPDLQYVVDKKNGNGEIIGVLRAAPEQEPDPHTSMDHDLSFIEGRSEVFSEADDDGDDGSHMSEYRRRKMARRRRKQERDRDTSFASAGTSYDEESDSEWTGDSSRTGLERFGDSDSRGGGAASPLEMLASLMQSVTSLAPTAKKASKKNLKKKNQTDEQDNSSVEDAGDKDLMSRVRDQCCSV